MGHLRTTIQQRRGAAVVEFAFVAVFLGIVTGGMIELARTVMMRTALTDASRKGASIGVAGNKTYSDIWNDVDESLSSDGELLATLSNGKATLTVTVATWKAASQTYGPEVVVTAATFAPNQYDKVAVKVSVQAADVAWLFLQYTGGTIDSETVVMMKQ